MRKLALLGVIVAIVIAVQPGAALEARPFASPFQSPIAALGAAAVRPAGQAKRSAVETATLAEYYWNLMYIRKLTR